MAHNMLDIGAAARAAAGPMPQQLERSAHDNTASVAAAEGENADTVDNPIAILYMTAMQNLGPSGVPEFEFVPDRTGLAFGCKLSIRVSPEATKTYEVPAVYRSQKLAKDGAARAALRDHVLTQIRAENSIEAQLRREAEADDAAALANGKGVLSQSQMAAALERGHGFLAEQMMLAGLPGSALDYSTFAGSTQPPSHGARLRITLGPGDVRTYEVDARFRNKREARSGVARQAIKSGLVDDLQRLRDNLVAERERQRTQRVQANGSGLPPPPPPRPGSIADEDADKLHKCVADRAARLTSKPGRLHSAMLPDLDRPHRSDGLRLLRHGRHARLHAAHPYRTGAGAAALVHRRSAVPEQDRGQERRDQAGAQGRRPQPRPSALRSAGAAADRRRGPCRDAAAHAGAVRPRPDRDAAAAVPPSRISAAADPVAAELATVVRAAFAADVRPAGAASGPAPERPAASARATGPPLPDASAPAARLQSARLARAQRLRRRVDTSARLPRRRDTSVHRSAAGDARAAATSAAGLRPSTALPRAYAGRRRPRQVPRGLLHQPDGRRPWSELRDPPR